MYSSNDLKDKKGISLEVMLEGGIVLGLSRRESKTESEKVHFDEIIEEFKKLWQKYHS